MSKVMQPRYFPIKIGGVYRCTIATVRNKALPNATEGTVIPCDYCDQSMILHDRLWVWNRESEVAPCIVCGEPFVDDGRACPVCAADDREETS